MADDDKSKRRLGTVAVHGGQPRVRPGRSVTEPVVYASTYPFENTAELVAFMSGERERTPEYGRYGNPTVAAAEAKLAALEDAEAGVLMASGMAAITTTLLSMLRSGQHIVFTADVYRKTRVFAHQILTKFGVEIDVVEPTVEAVQAAVKDNTRIIFTETPTNPYMRLVDIEGLVEVARKSRIKTIIDATFATPVNLRPLHHGVDLVMHSTTKYLGGHNDLLGGVMLGKRGIVEAIREQMGTFGAICDPHNAYLLLRGLKTLELRVQRQNTTALRLAQRLEAHSRVGRVFYPMLDSHPDRDLARRYLSGGGGVIAFELESLEAASAFIDRLQIPHIAPSLGGVESLVEQPPLMSFYDLPPEGRAAIGITEGLVRYSVGIEDPEDLERDLQAALDG